MKIDLLPKGTDMAAVGDWVLRATLAKKLKYVISRSFLSRNANMRAVLCLILQKSNYDAILI